MTVLGSSALFQSNWQWPRGHSSECRCGHLVIVAALRIEFSLALFAHSGVVYEPLALNRLPLELVLLSSAALGHLVLLKTWSKCVCALLNSLWCLSRKYDSLSQPLPSVCIISHMKK